VEQIVEFWIPKKKTDPKYYVPVPRTGAVVMIAISQKKAIGKLPTFEFITIKKRY
jgi:hypothetical protein